MYGNVEALSEPIILEFLWD